MILKHESLFYKDGKSDKVYNIQLVSDGSVFTVDFQFGRAGSELQTGRKIETGNAAEAEKAYLKVLKEKTAKGYREA